MKKLIFVLSLCAAPVFAQSNVTIYGVVDVYGQFLDGASRTVRLQSGGLSASRLGFRGSEDIGGGYRATFVLESGINIDDGTIGQSGALFGRQAHVGVETPYGRFSLGRQYASIYHATNDFSIFGNMPAGPSTAVIGGFGGGYEPVRGASGSASPPATGATGNGGPVRVNNSVRYESPTLQGLRVSLLYGAGEFASFTRDSRLVDAGARYTNGGLDLIGSFVKDVRAGSDANGSTSAEIVTVAGAYRWQSFRVVLGHLDFKDKRASGGDGRGFWVGGDWRLGNHLLKAQYVQNKPKLGGSNKTDAIGLGWVYAMSPRTALYSSVTRFDNDDRAGVAGLGRFNAAIPPGQSREGHNNLTEAVFGVQHSF